MKISAAGLSLIKEFEACRLKAYRCPSGVLTIGWGHTGKDVKVDSVWTQAKADAALVADVAAFEKDVATLVKRKPTQGQFDALVSFAFNVGSDIDADLIPEGLGDSTLLRLFNAGDIMGAADEFRKWTKSRGRVLAGLVRRREAERTLFLSGGEANDIEGGDNGVD